MGSCYVVGRVFYVGVVGVARVFLGSCYLLGCSGWLLWSCWGVARLFWVFCNVLFFIYKIRHVG